MGPGWSCSQALPCKGSVEEPFQVQAAGVSDSTASYLGGPGQITNLSGCLSFPISKMGILKFLLHGSDELILAKCLEQQ